MEQLAFGQLTPKASETGLYQDVLLHIWVSQWPSSRSWWGCPSALANALRRIVGTKVVAPLTNAMGFVDGQQYDLALG